MAFPSVEVPVEFRVLKLSDRELQAIRLPENPEQLILSINHPVAGVVANNRAGVKSWIDVFANGRMVCVGVVANSVPREDHLSPSELTWLLHLACNECGILTTTTQAIEDSFSLNVRLSANRPRVPDVGDVGDKPIEQRHQRHYMLNLAAGTNNLQVPGTALTLRPLRTRMKLGAFASLDKYVAYLVARAYLGTPEVRHSLLTQLNARLSNEHPQIPPFHITDLAAAGSTTSIELSAYFERDLDLGDHNFRRISGHIVRMPDDPITRMWINSLDYSKH